jgi:DNA-binding MarR family transcriptional regulator
VMNRQRMSHESPPSDIIEMLGLIHATSLEFRSRAEATAGSVGETFARTQVLATMLDRPRTLSSVARHLGIARQSVRPIMKQLLDRGLVVQGENPDHRTAPLYRATTAGKSTIDLIRQKASPIYTAIASELDHDEVRTLTDRLRLLLQLARETPRTGSAG